MLERIKRLCKERGMSVSGLEDACGVSRGTIGRWGENIPSVDRVARVAKYLGVSIDYLVWGKSDED